MNGQTMKKGGEGSNGFRKSYLRRASTLALGFCLSFSALADTTTLTSANASKGTSSSPVTMLFPVTRSGDLGFEAVLNYHTLDGTALAGTDYTATTSNIVIPAGSATATIPVTLSPQTGNGASLTFQLQLDSATGIGPAPAFAAQTPFATGTNPYSVTAADVNGDGKPDLIVANISSNTVSVLLNITAPGTTTPTFAAQQTFASGSGPVSVTAADVNGDGKPDLIVANTNDNTVSVLLNTTAPGATMPSFAAQQTFATGNSPRSVTAADVNGDGKPDLIVANFMSHTVSVLLNTTAPGANSPSFATQQTFATGTLSYAVAAADVNGDGKPDLIVANTNDNTVSVLLNTTAPGATTPSFAAQQIFATGSGPRSVTAADVNGDGKPDLIVANFGGNTVSVLLNTTASPTATLNFATQQVFGTETYPNSVAAADLNGDGKPDLIVANQNATGGVSVLLNTTAPGATTPSFATQQAFASGRYLYNAVAADVNGDGKPDLIMSNPADSTITVLLNTTAPGATTLSFAAPQTFAVSNPAGVTVADVNGDGKPDLIVVDDAGYPSGDNVSVLLSTTAPGATTLSFATAQAFPTGGYPHYVAVADVNGDGKLDLIVANEGDANVSVLLNTTATGATTPSFAAQQTFASGTFPYSVTVADINGDGKPDLIVANNGDNYVSVLLNTTAPGAATPSFAAQQTVGTGSNPDFATVADVDGDGKPDIISANYNGSSASVLLNTTTPGATTPSFATQQSFATGSNPSWVTAADINGDGRPDLIVANGGNSFGNTLSVLLNTQYQAVVAGSPAIGTIVHDYIFANGFE